MSIRCLMLQVIRTGTAGPANRFETTPVFADAALSESLWFQPKVWRSLTPRRPCHRLQGRSDSFASQPLAGEAREGRFFQRDLACRLPVLRWAAPAGQPTRSMCRAKAFPWTVSSAVAAQRALAASNSKNRLVKSSNPWREYARVIAGH